MAKKSVASFKGEKSGKNHTKCIKMIRSETTGAYSFQEEIIHNEEIKSFFSEN
jgi:hypothetical protein